MKKLMIWILILLSFLNADATNYYFSSVSGNDGRTVAQARVPATPWRSIGKLNSFFIGLAAGDSVLFKRGETFYGEIIVLKSGTNAAPIVISGYGTGAKPIIYGFQNLVTWTNVGGGIYETTNALLKSTLNMVTIDGVEYAMGRYPNANAANKGYLSFESHGAANTSITDNQLTASPDWSGAQLAVRTARSFLEKVRITTQSGTTLNYAPATFYAPANGNGYFIQNDIRTLDVFGEWFYDPATHKVSMFFGANNPASYVINAAAIDTLFEDHFDNITVNGLAFSGANMRAIDLRTNNTGVTKLLNCDIQFCGENGIFISTSNNTTVSGMNIQDCNQHGMFISGGTGYTVTNNNIKKIGLLAGMMGPINTNTGIRANVNNVLMQDNVIDSTGYSGLRYQGNNNTLRRNFVQHYCMTTDDGGGIYTGNATNIVNSGNKIVSNIVINGSDAIAGTSGTSGATSGIYLDDNTNGVIADSNSIANNNLQGIFMHNTYNISVRYNTIFNSTGNQLYLAHNTPQSKFRNVTVKRNIGVSSAATQYVMQYRTDTSDADIKVWGLTDSNYHARPIDDNLSFRTVITATGTDRNLAMWQTYSNYDLHSFKSPVTINNVNQLSFLYNETLVPKNFTLTGAFVDVKNTGYSGTISVQPFTSLVLISTGTLTTPVITWANPAAITYPTALSGTQLNATANVPGTFSYSSPIGTVLNAGTQQITVTFTPTDQTKYTITTKTVSIVVNKAIATLTYSNLSQPYNGTPQAPTVTTSPAGLVTVNTTYNGIGTIPTNAGSYSIISGLSNPNYTAQTISGTFVITQATATMAISNLNQIYNGAPKPVTVTTSPVGLSGVSITYNGSPTVPTLAGSYPVLATLTNPNYTAPTVSGTLIIAKATPTVTWTPSSPITYGSGLGGSQLNASASVAGTFNYTPPSGTILNAGVQNLSVDFTPTDASNYNTVLNKTASITVNKATATISLSALSQTYDGTPKSAIATTSPVGLTGIAITYTGSPTPPTNAGSYAVSASLTNPNYTATTVTGTLVIDKADVTISLSNLNQIYNATPRSVTVTTVPAGLTTITTTYNGSTVAPTNAGSYTIASTLSNANYQATPASGTLVIDKATPVITWATPSAITFGTALSGTQLNATSSAAGTFTYAPASGTILNAGVQTLIANFTPFSTSNYNSVNGTTVNITVNKAAATLTLGNLAQTFDGNPKSVTVTTSPVGLGVVDVTYNGSSTPPTAAGSYAIIATLTNDNYAASNATGTLVISTSSASVVITNLIQTYDGSPKPVTVTTNPDPYSTSVLYSDSPTPPTAAGSYDVVATINDGVHTGSASATLVIQKADPVITWADPSAITYGTALSGTQLNATANTTGVFTYTPASGAVLNAGTQILSARFVPFDAANYNTINSATATLVVNKAIATITVSNLSQPFDGNPKPVTVVTSPSGLAGIAVSYNGSSTPPTSIGTYTVIVNLSNTDYVATPDTVTLTITSAISGIAIGNLNQVYTGSPLPASVTTNPSGLSYTILYNGSSIVPTNAGSYTVIATLDDGVHSGADTETLVISKATPLVTWANPADITYGSPLTSTQLNAVATAPGAFTYSPASGTILNAGTQNLAVTYVPTDGVNYNTVVKIVTIVVNKAVSILTLSNLNQTYDGTPKPVIVTSTPETTGIIITYNGSTTPPTNAGSYSVIASLVNADYQAANVAGTLVIGKASPILSWNKPDPIKQGTALSLTQLNATSTVAGTFTYNPPIGTILAAGTQGIIATFTPASSNYNSATITQSISVYGNAQMGYWLEHGGTYFKDLPNQ